MSYSDFYLPPKSEMKKDLMIPYKELLKTIYENGHDHPDRTKAGRRSIFGHQIKFDLREGFPLVNTRKIYYKAGFVEMLWMLSGSTNIEELWKHNVHIWDKWVPSVFTMVDYLVKKNIIHENVAELIKNSPENSLKLYEVLLPIDSEEGRFMKTDALKYSDFKNNESFILGYFKQNVLNSIGPLYGNVWRGMYSENKLDQIQYLINTIKNDPYSARMVVSAWIPELIPNNDFTPAENVLLGNGCLTSCHNMFQCNVMEMDGDMCLNMMVNIRSSDVPIGLPYNISQYALLLSMLAQVTNYKSGVLTITLGDSHIYLNQLDTVKEELKNNNSYNTPKLILNPDIKNIFDFKIEDIKIEGYESGDKINHAINV